MSRSYGVSGDRWSNFDKFSPSSYRLRSKSPYRSNSSLSRTSSTSNLKIDDDYFNALNKSLGAHDASFMEEEDSGSIKSYNSLTRRPLSSSSTRNRYQSAVDNDDLSHKYRYGGRGKSYGSYDNDLNNNYPITTTSANKVVSYAASDSEPEYEPYSTYKYASLKLN
ncbi:hypothetical protein BLA29_003420 [Euroglyphus maynei]|uniref:Uncharacterized protein n=1 Tax=Euroglyphus maynei TaxID=6958 RepID=A0A1Y3AXP3_EURMA|nr:hypothetical protein BLA29_003420 [Euroglyphus maynei]